MSRWTPGKPIEQSMQVNVPFSRKDGHKVGNGRKAEKTLTAAVKEAEAARDAARDAAGACKAELEEMEGLARVIRERMDASDRTAARCVWVFSVLAAAVLAAVFWVAWRLCVLW